MIFDLLIRIIFAINILSFMKIGYFEYKDSLIVGLIVYIIGYILIYSFHKEKYLGFFNYFYDFGFLIFFLYSIQHPYLSLYFAPFWFSHVKNKYHLTFSVLLSIILITYGFYISNFSEYTLIALAATFYMVLLKFRLSQKEINDFIEENKEIMEKLYNENIKQKNFIDKFENINDLIKILRAYKNEEISIDELIAGIYDITKADGVVFLDFESKICKKIGIYECQDISKKEKYNKSINFKFNGKSIYILYKEDIEIDKDIFDILNDYLKG